MKAPPPGLYPDTDFETYRSWAAVSSGSLAAMARSPAHYQEHILNPAKAATDAMRFGSLCHTGHLEPLLLAMKYAVMPAFEEDIRRPDGSTYTNPRATGVYKSKVRAFTEANTGKEVVSQEQLNRVIAITKAIAANERANSWFRAEGEVELSFIWTDSESGGLCKGRVDKLTDELVIDMKTCRDVSDFEKSIERYHYHRQLTYYADGLHELTGVWRVPCLVAVEKEAPFSVMSAPLSAEAVDAGRKEYQDLLAKIADCKVFDHWPSRPDPKSFALPAWAVE